MSGEPCGQAPHQLFTAMAPSLTHLSIVALRARYLEGGGRLSRGVLARLARDPRKGARRLHRLLKQHYATQRAEALRLDAMVRLERTLWAAGVRRVAGVDEAGMGCLAGPVVAAAVVFPPQVMVEGVDDSKRLDAETRQRLAEAIRQAGAQIGIGAAEPEEIDRINIYHAGLLAMRRAVTNLAVVPQHLLTDGRTIPDLTVAQSRFSQGDATVHCIAAASIIAKTHRDHLMVELSRRFPQYGFERNKGYATLTHQSAIRRHGLCPPHRRSFPFLGELLGQASPAFYTLLARLAGEAKAGPALRFEDELERRRDELSPGERRKLRAMLARHRRQPL